MESAAHDLKVNAEKKVDEVSVGLKLVIWPSNSRLGATNKSAADLASASDVSSEFVCTNMQFVWCLQVENYLAADLTPHNATEAALQTGHIPSNTADVTHTSHGPGAGSAPVRCAMFPLLPSA